VPEHPPRCMAPHPTSPQITCGLRAGHEGDHAGRAYWRDGFGVGVLPPAAGADDFPTAKLPPIRDTVLRRPPPPAVRELTGRELLLALAEELRGDLDDEDDEPASSPCDSLHCRLNGCQASGPNPPCGGAPQ
jgi:hypothetical protein